MLDKLDADVAVRLDLRPRQMKIPAEALIIEENAVMGEGEAAGRNMSLKGVIVGVPGSSALCGSTGVADDDACITGNAEAHLMSGNRTLIDAQLATAVVSNTGSIRSACLGGRGQGRDDLVFLLYRQSMTVIHESKQTAHYNSSSTSTGSLM